MKLIIDKPELNLIFNHGENTFPKECCGAIIGSINNDKVIVKEIRNLRNINGSSKNTRYNIDPLEFVKLERELENSDLEILGIYHSHPDHPSKPSKFDQDNALPNFSYLVLAVNNRKAGRITSWRLNENSIFEEEIIIIGE